MLMSMGEAFLWGVYLWALVQFGELVIRKAQEK